jgi:hypothetical protein
MCTTRGVHRGAVLDGVARRLIGAEEPFHVVVEGIIPQTSVDTKPVIPPLETRGVGRVPGCRVCLADLTVDRIRRVDRHSMGVEATVCPNTFPLSTWSTYFTLFEKV